MLPYEERLAQAQGVFEAGKRKVATTPAPAGQKYPVGSFVTIGVMPAYMSHFAGETFARIEHTYAHAYGGNDVKSYALLIREPDASWHWVAWYEEEQLTQVTDQETIARLIKEIDNVHKS